ncbi:MAG: class I SAM-dependent DNA methyltransferase, partial [Verrucomicrobia bacterium]|nr:class I SAM-dependent DNA methyltransferase [Verrucomicrobiota bacterium]
LDPACGSGNFLYVSLQLLLSLEKEVIAFATQLGFKLMPQVGVHQLKAIEINPYAFELAQVSVQIGYLQWMRDNGFLLDRTPILQTLDGFENKDALLNQTFRKKPASLKAARAGEHAQDDALKVYTERAWPDCDVIVSNPPFLGTKKLRGELSDEYVEELFQIYADRIPNFSDLCCYWFEKARDLIEHDKCRRAGLLATQGIRGGLNREVLKRIQKTGGIFFAESDREWILDGANVHVSMIGFDNGTEKRRVLDGKPVSEINPNLTTTADTTKAVRLQSNRGIGYIADVKAGKFDLSEADATKMLHVPNPHGKPNSDVLLPWVNSLDILRRPRDWWIVDFGSDSPLEFATRFEQPFAKVKQDVFPERSKVKRKTYREYWWLHAEPCTEMRKRIEPLARFLVTTTVSKHRVFAWLRPPTLPDHQLVAFARDDDYSFGVLHSHFHEVWALKLGTRLETRPRYTPTTCFETFPFPQPTPDQEAAIAADAKELNELRERWLNPPEWTVEKFLEFPGSANGPWARYVHNPDSKGIGTVRYPRLEPKDADCAKKLKERTLTKLYNERPAWLDLAHKKLDEAVAAAYSFPADLTDEQILERLLELNLASAAAEAKEEMPKSQKFSRAKREDEMI